MEDLDNPLVHPPPQQPLDGGGDPDNGQGGLGAVHQVKQAYPLRNFTL